MWRRFERTEPHRFPYTLVIPAKAGIHLMLVQVELSSDGFPAFAGMTRMGLCAEGDGTRIAALYAASYSNTADSTAATVEGSSVSSATAKSGLSL
jgi:hypothetical protein